MTLATIIIRIWRRHRRHYLSMSELAAQPDLTISEMFALFSLKEKAKAEEAKQ